MMFTGVPSQPFSMARKDPKVTNPNVVGSCTIHNVESTSSRMKFFRSIFLKEKWTRRDLNPRPLRCERSDLPLIYEPAFVAYNFSAQGI